MEALYVLGIGELILLFLAYKISDKEILNPSMTFVLMFCFAIIVAIFYHQNWKSVTSYNWKATFIILSGSCLIVVIDYLTARTVKRKYMLYANHGRDYISISNFKMILIIGFDMLIVFLFYCYMTSLVEKYNAMEMYSANSLSSAYRSLYGHDTVVAGEDQIKPILRYGIYALQMSAYVCIYPFINNILIARGGLKRNIKYIIPCILFLLYGVFCGSRADVIKIFISGFIIFYILYMKNNGWKLSNIKKLFHIGVKITAVILVLFFAMSIIVGRSAVGVSILSSFVMQIAGYLGAPIIHFSQYMDSPVTSVVAGEECFTSFFMFLHNHSLSDIVRTQHLEYRRLTGGVYGNIYTFFRRPLSDFGLWGMYIFCIVVFVAICTFYYRYIKYAGYRSKDKFGMIIVVYSIIYQWIAYAPIDQISGEFVSVSFLIKLLMLVLIYLFSFNLNIRSFKLMIQ